MSRCRGLTLVELAVALALALMLGGVVHGLLLRGQRLARAQAERMALHESVRVAALVPVGELASADLLAAEPGAVTYLATRGGGRVCRASPGPPAEVVVEERSWRSPRAPRATDSLLIFVESDPATGSDDAWVRLGIAGVGAGSCPGGLPGIGFGVVAPPPSGPAALSRVTPGSPARLAEAIQLRYYRSGGKSWLGMRSVGTGETIQPIAGPLADSASGIRGLTLSYHDASGGPTSDPAAVRVVGIALVGVTDQPIHWRRLHRAAADTFTLTARVSLRNAPPP